MSLDFFLSLAICPTHVPQSFIPRRAHTAFCAVCTAISKGVLIVRHCHKKRATKVQTHTCSLLWYPAFVVLWGGNKGQMGKIQEGVKCSTAPGWTHLSEPTYSPHMGPQMWLGPFQPIQACHHKCILGFHSQGLKMLGDRSSLLVQTPRLVIILFLTSGYSFSPIFRKMQFCTSASFYPLSPFLMSAPSKLTILPACS